VSLPSVGSGVMSAYIFLPVTHTLFLYSHSTNQAALQAESGVLLIVQHSVAQCNTDEYAQQGWDDDLGTKAVE
jgi:hypothetical protein